MTKLLTFYLPFLAFSCAIAAQGSVIYSDLGPSSQFDPKHGYTVSGSSSYPGYEQTIAVAFTPSTSTALSQIDMALAFEGGTPGGTNSVMVSLDADANGLPGGEIAAWTLNNLPVWYAPCCTVETITPSTSINLNAGTSYWIVATAGAADTWAVWDRNLMGADGMVASSDGSTWSTYSNIALPAFDVLGNSAAPSSDTSPSAVPEPAAWMLLGGGLLSIGVCFRRRISG